MPKMKDKEISLEDLRERSESGYCTCGEKLRRRDMEIGLCAICQDNQVDTD